MPANPGKIQPLIREYLETAQASSLVQQAREQAEEEDAQAAESEGQETGRPLEKKEGTASVRGADQRLLRSGDPWRYGPCQGLLIRTLFATCRSPGGTVCVRGRSASCWEAPTAQLQGVRSLSGAHQRPLAKCRRRRSPGGTVRVRGRSASSCQVPTPWRYGPCQGALFFFSTSFLFISFAKDL
jgi:hypothetical protein